MLNPCSQDILKVSSAEGQTTAGTELVLMQSLLRQEELQPSASIAWGEQV